MSIYCWCGKCGAKLYDDKANSISWYQEYMAQSGLIITALCDQCLEKAITEIKLWLTKGD